MVTRAVSEHIFTLPKSFLTHFAMASGRPSPASISESQRTSQAMPKASSAPPIRSSANCRGQPSVWSRVGGNLQETRQPHRQVGVEAEEEGDEDLRELAQLIVSAQQQNLGEDEDDVHADHDLAHRHRHTGDEREHVGWGGDGRGAQVGADGQRGAKGYDKQYEDEAHVAADPLRLASFPLFHDE